MSDPFAGMDTAIFTALGEPATLEGVPVRVIPSFNVELVGEFGQVVERRTTLALLKSEAPNIARGQTLVFDGSTHTVDKNYRTDRYVIEVFIK